MFILIKIENRITFKTKTGHYLKLLTPYQAKLLGSTKSKIISKIRESCINLFLINRLVNY